jgi:hypothetical protein
MPVVIPEIQLAQFMTVPEIEAAYASSTPPTLGGYLRDAPRLTLERMYFHLGFPLRIRTNSPEVLRQCDRKWRDFDKKFDTEPMEAHIHVVATEDIECPPYPQHWFTENLLVMVANECNFCTAEFPHGQTRMVVSTAALAHPTYFSQIFLDVAPALHMGTRLTTPIHSACVAINGRAVLLCGDSGAGKTTLSYACARAGWQFVADDTSYLIFGETGRRVIGNCHHVRFRPTAANLFPEIAGNALTPRMSGKPSVELPTDSMPYVSTTSTAHADFVVFLNRREPGHADLRPYSKDVARYYMRQILFGTGETKARQYAEIERLLTAELLELRYQSLDWAIERLERQVREGH